jgi:predicted amidohydrolase
VVQEFWSGFPGLRKRLEQLCGILDLMAEQSKKKYGRGIDLAILPEVAVTGEISGDILVHSVPLAGAVQEVFSKKARELSCYVIAPTYLLENREKKVCSNVAILFGRKGETVGIYRKVHLAVTTGSDSMEGGMTPGKEARVFDCDFGKLGIQICFDMEYDWGWDQLARQGAELVAWPTQSPQTAHPAARALQHRCYIVSSTWRNNASLFEPTGKIAAQVKLPGQVLVEEIDLSYAILPWSPRLQEGKALRVKYGDKVGFHYYPEEDNGLFWSNDPHLTIGEMMSSIGTDDAVEELQRVRKLYHSAGVPGY